MTWTATNLEAALAQFDDLWDPRIVATLNDYDIRVTKVQGDYVWHKHDNTEEFFLVIDGSMDIWLRDEGGEHTVTLNRGDVFVVPKQMEHCPSSPGGASIVVIEPAGQPTTGDGTVDIPSHLKTTTGRPLR
jgi:mannose-6-phosphate isomerase-like protein (cupin superfamily)